MGTDAGLYASSDRGTNWAVIGLDGLAVSAIVRGDSGLFAAAYDQVYRSTNNGITWDSVQSFEQYVLSMASFGGGVFCWIGNECPGVRWEEACIAQPATEKSGPKFFTRSGLTTMK